MIYIRTDSSQEIGSGHVVRCITLAKELLNLGKVVEFITRNHKGNISKYIIKNGFKVNTLSALTKTSSQYDLEEYEQWLGTKQLIDANETIQVVLNKQVDWLIIDHYALDIVWEKELKPYVKKIMVIDDLANRNHNCDLLLDQNLFKNMHVRYQEKIPKNCIQLLGPKYVLLQSDYVKLYQQVRPRRLPLKNILIFFGGTDKHNITGLTLSALQDADILFDSVNVVVSNQSTYYEVIKNQVDKIPNAQLYSDLPSLAPLIFKADFAIGAGGATNWERLCLGLPSLVVTLAENQKPVSHTLHQMGLIRLIGDAKSIQIEQISYAIKRIISADNINYWSKHCLSVCSVYGATKVAHELCL